MSQQILRPVRGGRDVQPGRPRLHVDVHVETAGLASVARRSCAGCRGFAAIMESLERPTPVRGHGPRAGQAAGASDVSRRSGISGCWLGCIDPGVAVDTCRLYSKELARAAWLRDCRVPPAACMSSAVLGVHPADGTLLLPALPLRGETERASREWCHLSRHEPAIRR